MIVNYGSWYLWVYDGQCLPTFSTWRSKSFNGLQMVMAGHEKMNEYVAHLGMVYRMVYETYASFIDGYRWFHVNGWRWIKLDHSIDGDFENPGGKKPGDIWWSKGGLAMIIS